MLRLTEERADRDLRVVIADTLRSGIWRENGIPRLAELDQLALVGALDTSLRTSSSGRARR